MLDTQPEDRFDRITRLAAALFNVPIALVSLVDQNRQWFKSCHGLNSNSRETSRDAAFCSHVVYNREPMIVSDTFQDPRFADSPLVTNDPRIRFYAGCPLILDDGSCVGSFCLVDTRPRTLAGKRSRTPARSCEPGRAGAQCNERGVRLTFLIGRGRL